LAARAKKKKGGRHARLHSANDLLHAAWDVLEPGDLSEARWGDLRNVITSVLAGLKRSP